MGGPKVTLVAHVAYICRSVKLSSDSDSGHGEGGDKRHMRNLSVPLNSNNNRNKQQQVKTLSVAMFDIPDHYDRLALPLISDHISTSNISP